MKENEKVVVAPWRGENWTTVGDAPSDPRYLGFSLLSGDAADSVMNTWDQGDIELWATNDFHSVMAGEIQRDPVSIEQRYLAMIRALSVIVRDSVVNAKFYKDHPQAEA